MTGSIARLAGENGPADRQVPRIRSTGSLPLTIAAAGFFAFGLALTANSQITSGGTWTLYAMLMEQGARPYSDLHLPQQPLFFLYNRLWYAIGGQNWLLSQVSAAIILGLFCNGYFQLARRVNWPAWQRVTVFLTAAFAAIGWEYYSFFDYRAFSDVFALYAVIVLLQWHEKRERDRIPLVRPLILGGLCGLSFATRANDGVMLMVAVTCIVTRWFPQHWLRLTACLLGAATATATFTVLMTGDSFAAYFHYTLQSAAAMKGGSGQVVLSPALLAIDIVRYVAQPANILLGLLVVATAAPMAFLMHRRTGIGTAPPKLRAWVLIGAALLIATSWLAVWSEIPKVILAWFQLCLIALSIRALLGVLLVAKVDEGRSVLFLVPGGALAAAGMSSGGDHFGLFGPIGVLMVLVPVVFRHAIDGWARGMLLAAYALLAVTVFAGKIQTPMQWHHYRANPMFVDREIVDLPGKGPMLVDREMNGFFSEVCRSLATDGPGKGLLSLPYAYANYHCSIAPWQRYVQTYFDTSSAGTIDGLMQAIDKDPPTWIVYQRQLDRIRATEIAFNHGERIRHRTLDEYIWQRLQRHEWTVMRHWLDPAGSEWYFIRTLPPGSRVN